MSAVLSAVLPRIQSIRDTLVEAFRSVPVAVDTSSMERSSEQLGQCLALCREHAAYMDTALARSFGEAHLPLLRFSDAVQEALEDLDASLATFQRAESVIGTVLLLAGPTALISTNVYHARIASSQAILEAQTELADMLSKDLNGQCLSQALRRFGRDTSVILAASFDRDQYPGLAEVRRLMHSTRLSERQVTMWFTNRRCRAKKRRHTVEEFSDSLTHSPPTSPTSMMTTTTIAAAMATTATTTTVSVRESGDEIDDFFAELGRQADREFYQMMGGAWSGWGGWGDHDQPFAGLPGSSNVN